MFEPSRHYLWLFGVLAALTTAACGQGVCGQCLLDERCNKRPPPPDDPWAGTCAMEMGYYYTGTQPD